MRVHPAIAVVTIILAGLGLKLASFSAPISATDVRTTKRVSMEISEMHHQIKNLPVENFHDMTFVFSTGG
jgi:hypothetical protein